MPDAMAEKLNPIPFWFLRHGETDWNAQGLSQGRTDIPLNSVGLLQARRAAKTLVGIGGIATIVASPLIRAKVTAEIAAEALGLPVALDKGLQEVCFGEQEGQPMGDWYDDWIAGHYTPAGAEPFAGLLARAVAAINRATARPGPVLVVAHGALFRALRLAFGHEPNVRTPNALPIRCEPPADGSSAWAVTPAELAPE
ncbi:histidine phosphatase family protein [Belnapia rosea]|jgi:probable phosphoglycerate mutase|uniref:Probable phosphoglycerate mutase n=2 Tax=Belnapia rosea TaxID=938405 RepID=A0A1G6VM52_9PROT|nr:histidine phosphatase family protein [Belnapia rosea]SDB37292.1 probable phosphoglycerate mutase [Belnapia rosea]SDD54097.1 probable phosphoglycerate mutase [Belnapia rosea]